MRTITSILILTAVLMGCKAKQAAPAATGTTTSTAPKPKGSLHSAHAIIYRTKADYAQYVPVTLTDDGSAIASYPAPSDVFYHGSLAKPTPLANGYLLDNRGLNTHSAFIKMTYEDYSKLMDAPSLADLYKMIIDKAPFTEMYDLGPRGSYTDEVNNINTIIKTGKLGQYKKLL